MICKINAYTYQQDLQQSAAPQQLLQHESKLRPGLCKARAAVKSRTEAIQPSALLWPESPQFYCQHKILKKKNAYEGAYGIGVWTQPPYTVRAAKQTVLNVLPFFKLVKEIVHKNLYVRHDYHQSSPPRLQMLHKLSQFSILEKSVKK